MVRTRVIALVALMEVEEVLVEASTRARNVLTPLEVVGSTALSSCSLAS